MDITQFVADLRDAAGKRQNPLEAQLLGQQIDRLVEQLSVYGFFVLGDSLGSIFQNAKTAGMDIADLPKIFHGQARNVVTSHPTSVVHIDGFKFLHGIQRVILDYIQGRDSFDDDKINALLVSVGEDNLIRHDKRTPETEANFAALSIENYAAFSEILIKRVWASAKESYPDLQPKFFVQNILPFFVPAINTWSDRDGNDSVKAQSLKDSLPILQEKVANIAGSLIGTTSFSGLDDVRKNLESKNFLAALAGLDEIMADSDIADPDIIESLITCRGSLQAMTTAGLVELRQNSAVFTGEQDPGDTKEWLSVALESEVSSLVLADCRGIEDMSAARCTVDEVRAENHERDMTVIPLFERVDLMLKAPDTMREWVISQKDTWKTQGKTGILQIPVMFAYSDSTKNAGYAAATLALQNAVLGMADAEKEMNAYLKEEGCEFTVAFIPYVGTGSTDPARGGLKPLRSTCYGAGMEHPVIRTIQGGDVLQWAVLIVQGAEEQLRLAQERICPNNPEKRQMRREFSGVVPDWVKALSRNYSLSVYNEDKTDKDEPNRFLATLNNNFGSLVNLLNVSSRKSNKKPQDYKTLQGGRAIGISNLQAIMGGTFTALGDGQALWNNLQTLRTNLRSPSNQADSFLRNIALKSPTPEVFANVLYSKVPQIRPMIDPMAQIAIFFNPDHFWQQATGDNDLPDKETLEALADSSQDPMKKDAAKTVLEIEKTCNTLLQFLSGEESNLPLDEAQEALLSWMPYYREKRDDYHEALRDIAPIMRQVTQDPESLDDDLKKKWRTLCANLQFRIHNMASSGSTATDHGHYVEQSSVEDSSWFRRRLATEQKAQLIVGEARTDSAAPRGFLWDWLACNAALVRGEAR